MLTLIATLVVLGVLILVHEIGHFVLAKAVGIGVPRFSIGLGPKLWGIRRGETEYVISALPLGGYVRMAGMADEEVGEGLEGGQVEEFPEERRFSAKPLWARAIVICGGVAMNALFAWAAFAFLVFHQGMRPAVIGRVEPGSAAEAAGLVPGDRIVSVDGREVTGWAEFVVKIRERPGDQVTLGVERSGMRLQVPASVSVVPELDPFTGDTVTIGRLGAMVDTTVTPARVGVGYAIGQGAYRTWDIARQVVAFLGGLIIGRTSPRDVAGVITIGELSGRFARAGFLQLVWLMAFLSINLAIVNLLPIPILDGGHLIFLAVEGIRGKSLSLESRARLTQIGLIVIVAIMVWALTADVLRILGR